MGVLDGKVALITGAGQGVGKGIAEVLAEAGATMMLSGRTQSKDDAAAAKLRERNVRVKSMRSSSKCSIPARWQPFAT